MHPLRVTTPLALCALALGLIACTGDRIERVAADTSEALAQLPDCSEVVVLDDYQAAQSALDDIYIVSDDGKPVCATDFDGLEALATRVGAKPQAESDERSSASLALPNGRAESNPMPGHGTDPTSVTSMPGSGYASSNPMPGLASQIARVVNTD